MQLFKELTQAEKDEYRQWARESYTPGSPIKETWHPVIQEECRTMNYCFGITLKPSQFVKNQHVLQELPGELYIWKSRRRIAVQSIDDAERVLDHMHASSCAAVLDAPGSEIDA